MTSYEQIIRQMIPDVQFHQNRYAHALGDIVRSGCRWLDIGAGTRLHAGWLGPPQEELVSRARYVFGCDLLPDPMASNRVLTASVAADAGCLPFADESFDIVTANMVLEHLPDPARVFREVARVLTPGGQFLFVTPNRWHPAVWLASVLLRPMWRRRLARWMDRRSLDDIFPTCYLANTRARISRLATASRLEVGGLEVFPSYPILRRPSVAVRLEAIWIRTLRWRPLRRFGSNLIGQVRKSPTGRSDRT